MEKRIFLRCKNHDIPVLIEQPDSNELYPCVIMLHGLLAYKEGDGYLLRKLSKKMNENKIMTIRFDFASMGENRYARKQYHLKTMMEETKTVFDYVTQMENVDPKRICILGHSLGGLVACLTASLNSRCIVALNGVLNWQEPEFIRTLLPFDFSKDYSIIQTSDGRQELLYKDFFTESIDAIEHCHFFYDKPMLVCIGDCDPTVSNSIGIQFAKKEKKELLIIENANHTFNAKLADDSKVYELARKVNEWLDIHLK